jgi:hypothetical protein
MVIAEFLQKGFGGDQRLDGHRQRQGDQWQFGQVGHAEPALPLRHGGHSDRVSILGERGRELGLGRKASAAQAHPVPADRALPVPRLIERSATHDDLSNGPLGPRVGFCGVGSWH